MPPDAPPVHTRRARYPGKNPRRFEDKYKELNPERCVSDVQKVLASGKTPAGTHRPIMVDEVLRCLQPVAGDVAVDCTLGGGGHAQAILEHVQPDANCPVFGIAIDRRTRYDSASDAAVEAAILGDPMLAVRLVALSGRWTCRLNISQTRTARDPDPQRSAD